MSRTSTSSAKRAVKEVNTVTPTSKVEDAHDPAVDEDTPEQRAKRAFLGQAAQSCPIAKHASGGAGNVTIEAIVTRAFKTSVQGKKGLPVPKMQISFIATRISASGNNNTVVTTGIDGVAFGLPTKQLEASPEEIAGDANAKGPVVVDLTDSTCKIGYLGSFSASFYIEAGKPATNVKTNGKPEVPQVELCVPGTRVQIHGVSCGFGKNGDTLYTNAKKINLMVPPFSPADTSKVMIDEFSSAQAQSTAAFVLSQTMHGFFGLHYAEEALAQQATICKQMWEAYVSNSAVKCDAIAASLTGEGREESANSMVAIAARVRQVSPEDAASGTPLFNTNLLKDTVTPFVAPIVQRGMYPGAFAPEMSTLLFDVSRRDALPSSFVEGRVVGVAFKGNLAQVDYRLFFVFDRDKAIEEVKKGNNPVLHTSNAAASVKMTKRSLGPELVGSLVDAKIETACQELFPNMNQVAVASVYPHAAADLSLDGHFTSTNGFDFVDGICKASVQISSEFLDSEMLGKRGVHIYNSPEDTTLVEPATGAAPSPSLSKAGYQALSEGSFEMESLKAPAGSEKVVKFFVVYNGCLGDVTNNPSLATSVVAGEAHIREVVAAARDDDDVKAFLKYDALVYAVLAFV